MSETVGEAVVELRADVDRLKRDITSAGDQAGRGFTSRFSGAVKGLAAVAAGGAIAGFFKTAVSGAGDLAETISKTNVVFGKGSDAVLRFASQGAAALGQTKQEALDAASTFGVMGKMAGLTGGDLAGFSTKFTSLATDLASFHNSSPEEAIEAIGAALRGEAEPIRRFGVLLDDASLRAEAMRQGLIKSTNEALTPQQKVLASSALIMRQTADAQGDFQRTSGGLANQQRILRASVTDLVTSLGAGLLPTVNSGIKFVNRFIGQIRDGEGAGGRFAAVARQIGGAVKGFVADFRAGEGAAGTLKAVLVGIGGAVAAFVGDFVKGQGAAGALRSVLTGLGSAVGGVASAIAGSRTALAVLAGTVTAAVVAWKAYQAAQAVSLFWLKLHTVGTIQHTVVSKAAAAAARVWAAGQWVLNAAMAANPFTLVVIAVVALVAAFVIAWRKSETFRAVIIGVFNAVKGVVLSVLSWMRGFIVSVWGFIVGAVRAYVTAWRTVIVTAFNVVRAIVGAVIGFVRGVVVGGFNAIRGAVTGVMGAVRGAVAAGWGAIRGLFSAGVSAVVGFLSGLVGRVRGFAGQMLGAAKSVGSSIISGIGQGLRAAGGFVSDLAGSIKSAINNALRLPFTIRGPGPLPDFTIPAFATGTTSAPGGLAWVGEHGRELVYLPRGSQVTPAGRSRQLAAEAASGGGRGGNTAHITVQLPTGDPMAAAQAVASRWVLAGLT